MKALHSAAVNRSTGPPGSFESRTPTPPAPSWATSTQFWSNDPLKLLFRHAGAAAVPGADVDVVVAVIGVSSAVASRSARRRGGDDEQELEWSILVPPPPFGLCRVIESRACGRCL